MYMSDLILNPKTQHLIVHLPTKFPLCSLNSAWETWDTNLQCLKAGEKEKGTDKGMNMSQHSDTHSNTKYLLIIYL